MALEPNRPPLGVAFETSLLTDVSFEPNRPPFGVAFETSLLTDVSFEPNRPPFDVVSETPLLVDVAFESNRRRDGVLDVSLLGDTPLEPEKISTVDEGLVDPNKLLLEGGWVNALLPEGAEFEPNGLLPGDSVLF